MKQVYIQPLMEEVKIQTRQFLAGSGAKGVAVTGLDEKDKFVIDDDGLDPGDVLR